MDSADRKTARTHPGANQRWRSSVTGTCAKFLRYGREERVDTDTRVLFRSHISPRDGQLNRALHVSRTDGLENDRFGFRPRELVYEFGFRNRRRDHHHRQIMRSMDLTCQFEPIHGAGEVDAGDYDRRMRLVQRAWASSPQSTTAPIGTPIVSKHSDTAAMVALSLSTIMARPSIRSNTPVGYRCAYKTAADSLRGGTGSGQDR